MNYIVIDYILNQKFPKITKKKEYSLKIELVRTISVILKKLRSGFLTWSDQDPDSF